MLVTSGVRMNRAPAGRFADQGGDMVQPASWRRRRPGLDQADAQGRGAMLSGQQGVELALALERHHVVAAADVLVADEDLREGRCGPNGPSSPWRFAGSLEASISVKSTPFLFSSFRARRRSRGKRTGIDGDLGHGGTP
jgi:hypothetical protein